MAMTREGRLSEAGLRAPETVAVTADNFTRAESDFVFAASVERGGFGRWHHHREPMPVDYPVVRPNRDTIYSDLVVDLDAGPVTVTLPEAGGRFLSLQAVDEDQYTHAVRYDAGSYTFTRERVGTRYLLLAVRVLVDPKSEEDLEQVHALQDALGLEQPGGPGRWEVPAWDAASQKKVRDALLSLAETIPDTKRMFGTREQVDPIRHLIGTAMGWGGNPESEALYLNRTPERNDGATVYRLAVPSEVPVDGFWSITVYDAEGHLIPNDREMYALNEFTATRDADGSVAVQFGGCDEATANCLPISEGWNYMLRLYRPRPEVLDGSWAFPEASEVPFKEVG